MSKTFTIIVAVIIVLLICSMSVHWCQPEMFQLTNAPTKPIIEFTAVPEMKTAAPMPK